MPLLLSFEITSLPLCPSVEAGLEIESDLVLERFPFIESSATPQTGYQL